MKPTSSIFCSLLASAISLTSAVTVGQPQSIAAAPDAPAATARNQPAGSKDTDYRSGDVLVGFRPGAAASNRGAVRRSIRAGQWKTWPALGVEHWRLPPGMTVDRAIQVLQRNPNVEFAEPNQLMTADVLDPSLPDDPLFTTLDGLHNLGHTGGQADADIDALEAWALVPSGGPEIVVAIIDTGIDYNHPDLAERIWQNPLEIPDNGVDDDGNGFVDDWRGWDFYNSDNDPFDDNSHGTHVAGTVAAIGSNGLGVVGVAGLTPTVRLMPIKFLGGAGRGSISDAVDSLLYFEAFAGSVPNAVFRVSNNSWSGGKSKALERAIKRLNHLVVASAGNNGSDDLRFPAGYDFDHVLSVAATDRNDALASFSNFSPAWVDLGAPGVRTLSTVPGEDYRTKSGTSMASPHVTGAAALLLAHDSSLAALELRALLLSSVDPVPSLAGSTATGGRLNVFKALTGMEPVLESIDPAAAVLSVGSVTHNSVTLNWLATGDDGQDGQAFLYDLRYSNGPTLPESAWGDATHASGEPFPQPAGTPESLTLEGLLAETEYTLGLKIIDESGNTSTLAVITATTDVTPSGAWVIEVVDAEAGVQRETDIALDSQGQPHVVYHKEREGDPQPGSLHLASRIETGWVLELIDDTDTHMGHYASMAVDSQDRIHVAYARDLSLFSYLKHAVRSGTGWQIEIVDTQNEAVGWYASLALDNNDEPFISHLKHWGGNNGLKLAVRNASGWTSDFVERKAGRESALALDPQGNPHISYQDANGGLAVLRHIGGQWETLPVDPVTSEDTSLAVDAWGRIHVSYFDSDDKDLKYGFVDGDVVVTMALDSEGITGLDTSLALDSYGNPHIAYRDTTLDDLRYAWFDGTAWNLETVDWAGDVGANCSVTLDAADQPHISYRDVSQGSLKYAVRKP